MRSLMIVAILVGLTAATTASFGEDGYLESEGDAFISLGHCAGPNTKIAVDLQITTNEFAFNEIPFGSWGNHSDSMLFECYISYGSATTKTPQFSWEFSNASGARKAYNCDVIDQERHVISFDAATRTYKSGNFTYTFTDQILNITSSIPMSIFGRCSNKIACTAAHFGGGTKMKVYGVKIWESGRLIKDFVPCISGGIPGLRDMTNNVFVTGIDVSKVKYGGDIMEMDDAHIDIGDGPNDGVAGQSLYLYPNYQVGPNTRIELDYALLTTGAFSSYPFIFSAYNGSGMNMEFWIAGGKNYAFTMNNVQYYNNNVATIGELCYVPVDNIRRTVLMNSNSVAIVTAGWTNAVAVKAASAALTTTLGNMVVGARNNLQRFLPLRVYGLRFYESDVIVRNYVPFVTNGVPGMIDTVGGGTLFSLTKSGAANTRNLVADAGGVFDEHTATSEKDSYLEFPGTGSGLDTGYHVTPNSCIEADFSVWNTYKVADGNEKFVNQSSNSCVRLEAVGSSYNSLWWHYADANGSANSNVSFANERRQYILDGYNGKVTIKCGDSVLKDITMSTTRTQTAGDEGDSLIIGLSNAYMRLYGLKISESGEESRNYVPCVTNGVAGLYELHTNTFFPLTGGKVSGKGYKGQIGEFITEPQPMRIAQGIGSGTLTCFAPSAQSYEWYEDGVLISGETLDSLTLNWDRKKAKTDKHTYTYSVKPVYSVFNEKVSGEAVAVAVEYTPLGTIICVH